jgi:hypothetical protein
MQESVSEAEFIALCQSIGSPAKIAKLLGISERAVHTRRRAAEARNRIELPTHRDGRFKEYSLGNTVLNIEIEDGIVIVGSDCHYWPGIVTVAHRAFVKFCRALKPTVVVLNGDVVDGSGSGKWPNIGWEKKPTVNEEIQAANQRLEEIQDASPGALHVWPAGNHDLRFETLIANNLPQLAGVRGIHLKDHFSEKWHPCWRLTVNGNCHIKHREKGGIHAAYNNAVKSGHTVVTGHLHSLLVRPYTDMRGTRWGVDCGTLADRDGPQFINYTEAGTALDWRSGFVVLTFHKGKLLWPETVHKHDETSVEWRGGLVEV